MKHLITIILLFSAFPLAGQITAPGARTSRTTDYPSGYKPNDPVFIFCPESFASASLSVVSPDGTAPFTFEWYQWNKAARSFSIHLKTESGSSSMAVGVPEGGYRIRITDSGGYDTSMIAWVHLAQPFVEARLGGAGNCYYVPLIGNAAADVFHYYHPLTGDSIRLNYGLSSYTWFFNDSFLTSGQLSHFSYKLPYVDGDYKLVATDHFGCSAESSFFYESIHVKADFSIDPSEGEAPLEVHFTDRSIRASSFTWKFGDDSVSYLSGPVNHIYYKPGIYSATLVVESDLNCVDSMTVKPITVDPSSLVIPNVFSPDGDGINEYFRPDVTSLKYLDMQIFSRSGLLVYSYRGEGAGLTDWPGWDGTINNTGRKAAPGLYFFVIHAAGWDNIIYDSKKHRGFLYLYR